MKTPGRIRQGINAIAGVIAFNNLPRAQRRVVFYCEGKSYWPHLKGLVRATLEHTEWDICYISSSLDDPGLQEAHPRLQTYFVGMGFVRDYLFQSIDTDIMVLTMPDLHQYQVKRSRHGVHYIYVQHSLVSLHMVYRHGAFDHYDTICCAGMHHVREAQAIESRYDLPAKRLIELGYSRLDDLRATARANTTAPATDNARVVLIAPTWHAEGVIESGLGVKLCAELLDLGHVVILRPHPQTLRLAPGQVQKLVRQFREHPRFEFEDNVAGQQSLQRADVMVSDWSGAALEFAFARHRPVIFCDVPRKINNPQHDDIELVPLEVALRDQIGVIWDGKTPLALCMEQCESIDGARLEELAQQHVFNTDRSDYIFVQELKRQYADLLD